MIAATKKAMRVATTTAVPSDTKIHELFSKLLDAEHVDAAVAVMVAGQVPENFKAFTERDINYSTATGLCTTTLAHIMSTCPTMFDGRS